MMIHTFEQNQLYPKQHSLLLQQIESNQLSSLELTKEVEEIFAGEEDDLRFDDITILLKALVQNKSIRSIRLEGDFLDCLHPLRRSELLKAIGSYLPSLQQLSLGDSPVLVTDLCHVLVNSKTLLGLQLHDIVLQGTIQDFDVLQRVLTTHPSLGEVEIVECTTNAIPGTINHLTTTLRKRSPSPASRGGDNQRDRSLLYDKHLKLVK